MPTYLYSVNLRANRYYTRQHFLNYYIFNQIEYINLKLYDFSDIHGIYNIYYTSSREIFHICAGDLSHFFYFHLFINLYCTPLL